MTTPRLIDRRLLFVTGKGGVGKSSIAGALARVAANQGKRTLVVEMDAKGAIAQTLNQSELSFTPREVTPNLFAMAMNTEDALRTRTGSLPMPLSPSASASLRAGSTVSTKTRESRVVASAVPRAAAIVVLPTPPLPHTTTSDESPTSASAPFTTIPLRALRQAPR
ncbi:MAG: hypothetical protein EBZ55_07345 [Actinobacteria bacterium]|nr:hypothetical protein [Actinomycetota bacterium]